MTTKKEITERTLTCPHNNGINLLTICILYHLYYHLYPGIA